VSGEFRERLKARRPDVDWDAEVAAARERRDRQNSRWTARLHHWVHARLDPEVHAWGCSKCRK
jgi:hypothetical protein